MPSPLPTATPWPTPTQEPTATEPAATATPEPPNDTANEHGDAGRNRTTYHRASGNNARRHPKYDAGCYAGQHADWRHAECGTDGNAGRKRHGGANAHTNTGVDAGVDAGTNCGPDPATDRRADS